MTLTVEQQDIFNAVQEAIDAMFGDNRVIHIDAKAGTGKTTLTKYIVDKNPGKSFVYTAFNKKIVADGIGKFGEDNCKTFHAFAYQYVGRPKVGGFYPPNIRLPLTYAQKKLVVDMLDKYCLSKHLDPEDFYNEQGLDTKTRELIYTYLDKMGGREIPITFNYMLKELHHNLADGDTIINLDMLFVDEAQDLTPVMLEIFGLVTASVKVYLGDTSQDIYTFLDLVSAFTLSKETYNLTESFRLSPAIAKKIEPFCQAFIDPGFKLIGKNLTPTDSSEGYITHSNAEIIAEVVQRQKSGDTYSFTRPVKEIFEVALAINQCLVGNFPKNPKYWAIQKLIKQRIPVRDMVRSEELDDDIIASLKLLQHLNKTGTSIVDVLNEASSAAQDPHNLIGTAHSVKGLEFGVVTLSNGLNTYVEKALKSVPITEEEENEIIDACKLYYVACSRAKHKLINATQLKT